MVRGLARHVSIPHNSGQLVKVRHPGRHVEERGVEDRARQLPLQLLGLQREKELFIDNLLVRFHLIIEMILVDRPCAMEV